MTLKQRWWWWFKVQLRLNPFRLRGEYFVNEDYSLIWFERTPFFWEI